MTFTRGQRDSNPATRDEFVLISRDTWALVMRTLPFNSAAFTALLAAAPCTWDDVEDIGVEEWHADLEAAEREQAE
jgi:hypothetical protein